MIIEEQIEDNLVYKVIQKIQLNYRKKIDQYILYKKSRWLINIILMIIYANHISTRGGFYIITYVYCIYQLQLIIEYFTPLGLPPIAQEDEENDDETFSNDFVELPTTISNKNQYDKEHHPLLRTTSEFQAWQKSVISILIAFICTFIPLLDIPVFWPFLFGYFFMIVGMSVKKYFNHMKKYGYSILDFTQKK